MDTSLDEDTLASSEHRDVRTTWVRSDSGGVPFVGLVRAKEYRTDEVSEFELHLETKTLRASYMATHTNMTAEHVYIHTIQKRLYVMITDEEN
ncbi:hypothetical protein Tco_1576142 [Tanacetum coccineum]